MDNRNPNFPFEIDFVLGDRWISTILQGLNISVYEQINLYHEFLSICHAYFATFLNFNQGLFLNNHDFQNICRLFDNLHDNASVIIGHQYVFFLYCRVIACQGHVPLHDDARQRLLGMMNDLELFSSPDADVDHTYHQPTTGN